MTIKKLVLLAPQYILFMILSFILLFLFIALVNTRLAAFILIILLPSYLLRFNIGFLPTTFLEVMIVILALVWFIKKIKDKNLVISWQKIKDLLGRQNLIIISLFIISATVAVFISSDTRAALGIWKAYFIEPIILLFIFLDIFSKRDIPKIIFSLALSAFLVSTLAIIQKFTGWFVPYTFWGKDNVFRVTSFYGYPNAIGLFLGPIIPLLVFYVAHLTREFKKNIFLIIFLLLTIIFSFLAIFWANSTGAIMGLLLGIIITGFFYKKTIFVSILLFLIFSSVIYFNILPQSISDTLLLKDWSGQVRIKMWTETFEMLKHNFIFSPGLSNYQNAVAPYHIWSFVEIFQYPHNLILNFWSEIGLLGLFSFLALVIIFFKKIIFTLRQNQNRFLLFGLIWSMFVILIHGLVDVPYFKNDLAVLFWLIFGIIFLLDKK